MNTVLRRHPKPMLVALLTLSALCLVGRPAALFASELTRSAVALQPAPTSPANTTPSATFAQCTTNAQCNDNNVCTTDVCNAQGRCTHTNTNGVSCSDGNACTTGDVCTDGACVAGTAVTCNDNNACTDDSCAPATGCVFQNNSAACSDGNVCTAPDVCSAGACTAGSAVSCDDGLACTTDTCDAVTGCAHADSCATGSLCNHATGVCEWPDGQLLPIALGNTWRYFKGTAEPSLPLQASPIWAQAAFDDSAWLEGPSGFGYGSAGIDCEAQRTGGTNLADMRNSYTSLYIRKKFVVPDPASVYQLKLTVYFDDGFVAYVNGHEVARNTVTGTPPAYNTLGSSHECTGSTSWTVDKSLLVSGVNVIAIQGHNVTLSSSDFVLAPMLEAVAPPNQAPAAPANPSIAGGSTGINLNPQLCVDVADPEASPLNLTFYGRESTGVAGDPFTIVVLPDPQNYTIDSGRYAIYRGQTQWAVDNRIAKNVVYVQGIGDMTNDNNTAQWTVVDSVFDILDVAGMPYSMCIGNHDQTPAGNGRSGTDEGATTVPHTSWFGLQRLCPGTCSNDNVTACVNDSECVSPAICNPGPTCRNWYGGRYDFGAPATYPRSTDNYYTLFSASGMDFIVFNLEVDTMDASYNAACTSATCLAVVQWVKDTLAQYPARRAIVFSHSLITPSAAALSPHGQVVYDALKNYPQVFLMMSGHLDQANHRADTNTVDGQPHTIYSLVMDYQSKSNGGNGWMRVLTFEPQNDRIHVETYSPYLGRFINKPTAHSDNGPNDSCTRDCYVEPGGTYSAGGNELMLPYEMDAGAPFETIATATGVASGTRYCVNWPNRDPGTTYEWYVAASDGATASTSPRWTFTTTTTCTNVSQCDDGNACTIDGCTDGTCANQAVPNCCTSAAQCDDGDVCTTDTCTGNACAHANNTAACSDGNACTAGDVCANGVCAGTAANCDDGIPCTQDTCAPATGCSHYDSCPTGYECNLGNGQCEEGCTSNAACDDGTACTLDTCAMANGAALDFDGTNDYVTMGAAAGEAALGARAFTLEAWIKRDGTTWGATASTGNGGFSAVPLVTKGRGEAETGNVNANYFLGIMSTGRVVADFEQIGAAGGWADGQNHPICGTALITDQNWHHVAASYSVADGWRIYVDGVEGTSADGTTCTTCSPAGSCPRSPGVEPEYDSIQHFGIGTAMNSTGVVEGYFAGQIDDVRVWNRALSAAELQANMHVVPAASANLIGRWDFDAASGTVAADATSPAQNGTLTNGPVWITADLAPVGGSGTCAHTPTAVCCTLASECGDGNVCTTDTCTGGACAHEAVAGCCQTAADCDDANACTTDVCTNNTCSHVDNSASCSDGVGCTTDSCAPATGCVFTGNCASGQQCNLASGTCEQICSTSADCADGNACTTDTCLTSASNTAALDFDGTNDHLDLGNDGNTSNVNYLTNFGTGSFSIEGWFRADTATTYMGLFRQGSQNAYPQVVVQFPGASPYNRIAGSVETTTSGTQVDVVTTQTFTLGQWYHYALVADRVSATQTLTIYLHDAAGALVGSATTDASVWSTYPVDDTATGTAPNVVRDPALIGVARTPSPGANYNYYFDGRMDEIRIWDHARTAQQVQDGLFRQIASATGLVHRWAMNEATGTTVADLGGTPTTPAVLTNGAAWATDALPALSGGVCSHAPLVCDDGNVCTSDACDTALGCVTTNNSGSCNDSNACTTGDVCSAGTCGGTAVNCNDNVACTIDSCNTATGCVHAQNCPNGGVCNAGTGVCVSECAVAGDCNDGNACTVDACPATDVASLDFDGTNDYVTMGAAAGETALGARAFTLEAWIRRDGTSWGATTTTGTGGLTAIPLITKGRGESETGNLNTNYFFGITTAGKLVADMEQILAAGGWAIGQNHPICGTGTISDQNWHHVAVSYSTTDGWRIYIDGVEGTSTDGSACTTCSPTNSCPRSPGVEPEYDSIQHFGLGTAMTSTGVAAGFFAGRMDEARVWNRVLSAAEIQANMSAVNVPTTNLLGRWSFEEATGTTAADSTTPAQNGTLTNGPVWITNDVPTVGLRSCTHTAIGGCCTLDAQCDDANLCTVDTCTVNGGTGQGTCGHQSIAGCCATAADCDDANVCTTDSCSANACSHTNNTASCDDGTACTSGDVCAAGVCGGAAVDCDDGIACTDDTCSALTGCAHTDNCGALGVCNLATGQCEQTCTTSAECNDGNACTNNLCLTTNAAALDFDGTNDYVTMGPAAGETALGAHAFTLEAWIRRDGASWGTNASTGTGGISAVPLITKGRGESEAGNLNANYFLGITAAGKVVADFEQIVATGGWSIGQNHPICGTATITDQNWHHVAATYSVTDGWRIYVDGVEGTSADGTACTTCSPAGSCPRSPAVEPEYDSIQHFGVGTAMNSSGVTEGYFAGQMDEVRVWNRVRLAGEIATGMFSGPPVDPTLIGAWNFDAGSGTLLADLTVPAQNGTLTNGPVWITGNLPSIGASVCHYEPIPECCTIDADCNDADPCTLDTCGAGTCSHAPVAGCCVGAADCDDGNVCTTDGCAANACTHAPNTLPCNDGDACTTLDTCASGVCAGATVDCSDGVGCTIDSCDPASGCAHTDSCTNGETCNLAAGVCLSGCFTATDCDDANACTTDSCSPTGGAGLDFDGTNDYLNLGNDDNTAEVNYLTNFGTGSFSIEGWFRADTATTYMGLFRQGSQNAYPQVVVQFPGAAPFNRLAGSVETSTTGTQIDATMTQTFTLGAWYHYAMVADRTPGAQSLTVYLHDAAGALVGSATTAANAWSTYPVNDTFTGTAPNVVRDPAVIGVARTPSPGVNYNYYFDGRMDEVRVWSHARTAQQVQDDLFAQLASAPGLVHRWAMNEGAGTTTADTGATPASAATLINGTAWVTDGAALPGVGGGACSHTGVTCSDGNVCTDDSCDPQQGCVYTNNNATCDDGNPATFNDVCVDGVCAGSTLPPPTEVTGVAVTHQAATTIAWTHQDGAVYDVATGALSALAADGGVAGASCLANDVSAPNDVDARPAPGAGDGYYYVVRAQNAAGTGTYGFSSAGVERAPTAACP